ncbi:MAG TPA: tRNA (adenosine(37)-N6)-dimethylallyltransferase MiaA [Aquabacterium sp.]|uniref:tRNA (adenosine(37)-N6)-dimethylallyltransferase MiaA n=1 Tax=Aquabacterium sp. TaxID=1872578 RepID=UPI002D9258D6|nr:tRNA (adenosine(37)-N6)-dimethylallyltransferase MiaA [Aquabacterium sp.]HET6789585.1 tRNA (adenosine(37)-N6)-dimethylallyltransferase MiaA [Aquabacterium sp.]HEX5371136.1 tRNA (adenosine(37)-N6)-dimethylallyltransferase MiaA [Aquabacterium sp.]
MSTAPADARTLILAGPTASGKTALALQLAQALPIEIISVDSALIYRGMDIGTAKPSAQELATVPHHLIDILDPTESYSAARFVNDARRLMAEIRARGRLPLLVGGTMLYIKALVEGIDDIPSAAPDVRAQLDQRALSEGWPALHAELMRVDPLTAARLAPNDSQRIQRALEVWLSTGRPISSYQRRHAVSPVDPEVGSESQPAATVVPDDVVLISLEPTDRRWLHERIHLRFEQMMAHGLIEEVLRLRQRPDLHLNLPSIRCVGYRQVWEALDAGLDLSQPEVRAAVAERGAAATRQLAKRQITWLRSMPWRHVIACDTTSPQDAFEQALARMRP